MFGLVVPCDMPKQKTVEKTVADPAVAAEPKKKRSSTKKTAAPAATHKRATKKATRDAVAVTEPSASVPQSVPAIEPEPVVQPEAPVALSAPLPSPVPTNEEIAKLAYSYWVARGYQPGSPQEDWLRAERELRSRNAPGTQSAAAVSPDS